MPKLFPFILYCVYCCLNVLKIESFIETNKHTINETSSFSWGIETGDQIFITDI